MEKLIKERLRDLAFHIFDCGWKEQPDYKMYPEQQPWIILLTEMILENSKELKDVPYYLKEAIKDLQEPKFYANLNMWQVFNSSMQFSVGEGYIWAKVIKGMKDRPIIEFDIKPEDFHE